MTRILQPFSSSWIDYPDNESLALTIVMMGCDNGCHKCQNPEFQNPLYDNMTKEFTPEELEKELQELSKRYRTNKLVMSGGDPLAPCNIEFTKKFLEITTFDVCIYTGHNIDWVKQFNVNGFKFVKCGKFDYKTFRESLKTDDMMRFASPNQELYNNNFDLLSKDGIYYFNN